MNSPFMWTVPSPAGINSPAIGRAEILPTDDGEVGTGPSLTAPGPSFASGHQPGSRRSKYKDLGWSQHKADMKKLYMDQNESLGEVMKAMAHKGFFASYVSLSKSVNLRVVLTPRDEKHTRINSEIGGGKRISQVPMHNGWY
jgi:hypothetical protein